MNYKEKEKEEFELEDENDEELSSSFSLNHLNHFNSNYNNNNNLLSSSSSLFIAIPNNNYPLNNNNNNNNNNNDNNNNININNNNNNNNNLTLSSNDSLTIPTLYIYAILQRIAPKIEKHKYLSQLLFNFLKQQLNEPDYSFIKEWMLKKLDIDVNEDEIGYLLQYLRIRVADQFFDSSSYHIFKAPSSKHYPRWSNKLKSLAIKYEVPVIPVRSVRTPKKEKEILPTSPKPLNLPTLRKAYSLKRKTSSRIEDSQSPKTPPPLSPPFVEKPSRLPQVKATTQHVQELMQEHKEMSKHVSKIFHSKKLR